MSGNFRRFPGNFRRFPGNFRRFPGNIRAMFFCILWWFPLSSMDFMGLEQFKQVLQPKKRIGSDSLNTGGIFQQKTAPMVDTQVIGFEMCGRNRIKLTLGRNRFICLQEGKSAPKGNFRFSLGRSASKGEEPLLPLAEEISYL